MVRYPPPSAIVFRFSSWCPSGTTSERLAKLGKSSHAKVFVINNNGTAPLTTLNVTLKGELARDFRIVKKPAHSVAPGMSTQFNVIYKPVKARNSKVMLKISNTDKDENPFRVELTGKGVK